MDEVVQTKWNDMNIKKIILMMSLNLSLAAIPTWAANPTLHLDVSTIGHWPWNGTTGLGTGPAIGLGYSPYHQELIFTANYDSGVNDQGTPQNFYHWDLSGSSGPFPPFSNVGGLIDEIYMAIPSASIDGFTAGEVFTPAGDTLLGPNSPWIMRINPDGSSVNSQWAYLSSEPDGALGECGMLFDDVTPSGSGSYRLLVTSPNTGNLYKIANNGTVFDIIDNIGPTHLSCVALVTNDPGTWANLAGQVLTWDETTGKVYIANPNDHNNYITQTPSWINHDDNSQTFLAAERLFVIPQGKEFWFVNYAPGQASIPTDFRTIKDNYWANLQGSLLLATEFPNSVYFLSDHQRHQTHFWTLRPAPGGVTVEPLLVIDDLTGQDFVGQVEGAAWVPKFQLINVQFGYTNSLVTKTGAAVYGNSPSDYWNPLKLPAKGSINPTLNNLKDAAQVVTPVGIAFSGQGGLSVQLHGWFPGSSPFNDPMMQAAGVAYGGYTFNLTITGLSSVPGAGQPAAYYDIYVYAYAGQGNAGGQNYSYNGVFSINPPGEESSAQTAKSVGWSLTQWVEGNEYVVFRRVPVSSPGQTIVITGSPDPSNPLNSPGTYVVINGIQILAKQ